MDTFPFITTQEDIEASKTLITLKYPIGSKPIQVSAFFSMPFTTTKNDSQ